MAVEELCKLRYEIPENLPEDQLVWVDPDWFDVYVDAKVDGVLYRELHIVEEAEGNFVYLPCGEVAQVRTVAHSGWSNQAPIPVPELDMNPAVVALAIAAITAGIYGMRKMVQ